MQAQIVQLKRIKKFLKIKYKINKNFDNLKISCVFQYLDKNILKGVS
jgi:hypothetical protein